MGKKKTPNKNIQKKRREKELKRIKLKKKNSFTVKNRQKTHSMSRMKDNLRLIPLIALEPEIMGIIPQKSPEELVLAADSDVERINLFYDDFIHNAIVNALDVIEERYKISKNKTGLINLSSVKYFMNEKKYPGMVNHIVVVKYFAYTNPDLNLNTENVISFIENFELENAEILNNFQLSEDDAQTVSTDEESLNEFEYTEEQSEVVQTYMNYLADTLSDEENNAELVENFEVFYNDYLVDEKNVADLNSIKTNHITLFYDYYFLENMNPTDADKKSMAKTLLHFTDMLYKNGTFTEDNVKSVKNKLL